MIWSLDHDDFHQPFHSAMRVLVTGATGFVGSALLRTLASRPDFEVRGAVRQPLAAFPPGAQVIRIEDLSDRCNWEEALEGVTSVVHAAARVHVMDERSPDPLAEFRRVNVAGTLRLAEQAAAAGVRRFVFISSIKAMGESTTGRPPYSADESPAPVDPYGISKLEAERALRQLASSSGMEVAIMRPVLVYGPGVKGNFLSMMRWLHRGIPLPLGAVHNRRSLVALDNLMDLVVRCLTHPAAANQTFLVSDGVDLSTTDLLRSAARALGVRHRLIPVPPRLIAMGAAAVGRRPAVDRLLGSLQVDISKTRALLDWAPPVSVEQGLQCTADALLGR